MRLNSSGFEDSGRMPDRFGAANENSNPPLEFEEVPESAESLVLLMYDPDAEPVVGHPFDHWTAYNISPETRSVEENSGIDGATMGATDAGQNRYYGPKPPDGEHTYVFELYALDSELELPEGAERSEVEREMEGRVIDQATLRGTFSPEQY